MLDALYCVVLVHCMARTSVVGRLLDQLLCDVLNNSDVVTTSSLRDLLQQLE